MFNKITLFDTFFPIRLLNITIFDTFFLKLSFN